VVGIAFAPDSSELITVTDGYGLSPGTLIDRNLSGKALVTAACKAAGSSLTRTEWRTYIGTAPPAFLACQRADGRRRKAVALSSHRLGDAA
jgi:hypothetical protein